MKKRIFGCLIGVTALALMPTESMAQVSFLGFGDLSNGRAQANIVLDACNDQTPAINPGDTNIALTATCARNAGETVVSATSTIVGEVESDAIGVTRVRLRADAVSSAVPAALFAGSFGADATTFLRADFDAASPILYEIRISGRVDDNASSNSGNSSVTATSLFEFQRFEAFTANTEGELIASGTLPAIPFNLSLAVSALSNGGAGAATSFGEIVMTFTPILSGGCCIDDACTTLTSEACAEQGGVYAGDNLPCVDCEPEPVCDLAWAAPAPGNFADQDNWEPAVAPEACANLTLNQEGAYAITVDSGILANSLAVLNGEPSLFGGSLSLGGQGVADALRVEDAARLFLGSGTLSANGAVVGLNAAGGDGSTPSFLRIEPGATLDVVGGLDLGRELSSFGELTLGGGAESATLSVAGGANIGVFGRGRLLGLGNLELTALDGMTLGVFAGSDALVELTGEPAGIRTVLLNVGETLTIGDGGRGVLTLANLAVLETDHLAIGASEGGNGTFSTSGANSTVNISTAMDVGDAGTGDLTILEGSGVSTPLAVLGKSATGAGTVTIEGQDSRLAVSGDLTVGERGPSTLSANAGGIIEAGSLAVASGAGVTAALNLDGSVLGSRVTVANDMTLGSFGDASIRGDGGTEIAVGGSLTMGTFTDATAFVIMLAGEGEEALQSNQFTVADTLTLGAGGAALVEFRGLSLAEAGSMRLGALDGGRGVYKVNGSLNVTTITGQLSVAGSGEGEVSATDGATIRAGACVLGEETGGLGTIRLESGATLVVEAIPAEAPVSGGTKDEAALGFLIVGQRSNGLIELFDAATQVVCENISLGGENEGAGGTLSIDTGATLTASGSLTMGNNVGPALLRMARGGTLNVGAFLELGPNGLLVASVNSQVNCTSLNLNGRARIVENVTIDRPAAGKDTQSVTSKGAPEPLIINGDLLLGADGVLEVAAIDGTALQVNGAATLAGTLEIALEPGTVYADNQLINLIDFAGGVSGSFASTTFLNAPEGFEATTEVVDGVLRLGVVHGGTGTGAGEGEGEGEIPGGCNAAKTLQPLQEILGDWATALFGLAVLLGSALLGRPDTL